MAASFAVLVIVLAGFAIRLFRLAQFGLSGDEALAARFIVGPIADIVRAAATGDPHPPLFYLALRVWSWFAGDGEFALRFFSVATGLLVVPLVFVIGRWLFGQWVGGIAAAVLAIHPYQIWYAHEVRMYAPLALLSTLSMACLVMWLRRPGRRSLAMWTISAVALVYVHYYGAVLVAGENVLVIGLWLSGRASRRASSGMIGGWAVAQLAVGLAFVPWLLAVSYVVTTYNGLGWSGPGPLLSDIALRYSAGHSWQWAGSSAVGAALAAMVALGLAAAFRVGRPLGSVSLLAAGFALLCWTAFPLVVGLAGSLWRPMLAARYLMVSSAGFALATALAVVVVARVWRPLGAVPLAIVLFVSGQSVANLFFSPEYARDGYDRLTAYIADHGAPDDVIIVGAFTQQDQFQYYYRRRLGGTLPSFQFPVTEPVEAAATAKEIGRISSGTAGIWYLATDTARYDPNRITEQVLSLGYHRVLEKWFGGDRLLYFAVAPDSIVPSAKPMGRFGDAVEVAGVRIATPDVRAGGALTLTIVWNPLRRVDSDLRVAVALLDPDGHLLAATDRAPGEGFLPTTAWMAGTPVFDRVGLAVPDVAAPAAYRVVARLYDPASGRPLPAIRADGQQTGDSLDLGTVNIAPATGRSLILTEPTSPADLSSGGARLVGFDPPPDIQYVPGASVGTRMFWRGRPTPTSKLSLKILDADGTLSGTAEMTAAPEWSLVSPWPADRPVAVHRIVALPPRLATGSYNLRLTSPDTGASAESAASVAIGRIRVVAPARDYTLPKVGTPVEGRFVGVADLIGVTETGSPGSVTRGGTFSVTLHWRVTGEPKASYKVFTHLIGPDGKLYGQKDGIPDDGARPTTGWVAGEYLNDGYGIGLAANSPPGKYVLRVGLYEESSGKRVPVAGGGDFVDAIGFDVR